MEAKTIVKEIMKESGTTQIKLAKLIDTSQSSISEMLSVNMGMKVLNLYKIADALGYEVVVRKKKRGKLEEGYRRLTSEEEKETEE